MAEVDEGFGQLADIDPLPAHMGLAPIGQQGDPQWLFGGRHDGQWSPVIDRPVKLGPQSPPTPDPDKIAVNGWPQGYANHCENLTGSFGGVRALIQRVHSATVTVQAAGVPEVVGEIGAGLVALIGVTHDDTVAVADKVAAKIARLRILDDATGVMNESVLDHGASVLVVSQFTLYGETAKGNRPSWIAAARPEVAEPLVERVVESLRGLGVDVATGRFRTDMDVALVNAGPATVLIEI